MSHKVHLTLWPGRVIEVDERELQELKALGLLKDLVVADSPIKETLVKKTINKASAATKEV